MIAHGKAGAQEAPLKEKNADRQTLQACCRGPFPLPVLSSARDEVPVAFLSHRSGSDYGPSSRRADPCVRERCAGFCVSLACVPETCNTGAPRERER